MTPEDRSLILQIVGLIITAVIGYLVKKQGDKQSTLENKVDNVVLKFDPITRTLDGQLEAMKRDIAKFANQEGRMELLAEQAIIAAAVTAAQTIRETTPPLPVVVTNTPIAVIPHTVSKDETKL